MLFLVNDYGIERIDEITNIRLFVNSQFLSIVLTHLQDENRKLKVKIPEIREKWDSEIEEIQQFFKFSFKTNQSKSAKEDMTAS